VRVSSDTKQPSTDYGAKDIQVLEGLDPVRKRPGMYIGSTGLAGLHHLIWEVVDNAVDEAMAGFCTRIGVTLLADGGCRVDDNGRGIPVDPYPSGPHKGKSAAEVVLTVLHAGGKFGGDGYKVSGGLHGVGVSVVNALSERLFIEIDKLGKRYQQEYAKGGKPQGKLAEVGPTPAAGAPAAPRSPSGPTLRSSSPRAPSSSARTVLERLQTMAFLNKGLEIVFRDERPGKEQDVTFQYKGGIVDFVKHLNMRRRRPCSARSPTTRTKTPRAGRRSTSPSSGTPGTTKASTATPTASPPSRVACTSRASRPRSPAWSTSTRAPRTC
jgi:DNA gyrase subunit B